MKKNIALFMIFNMIMVIFTVVNIQPVYAEQNTCCVMENSCSLMSASDCTAINGRNSYAVSCNSVPECVTGCCVTASSCDSGRTKTYCNLNGGSWGSGDCSGNSECATGVCIVNGICYDSWNKRQCDAAGPGAQFDASIQDCNSANSLTSGGEGCCIIGNSYTRTVQSACNGGRFVSGYLCSYSANTGSNCLPRDHKTCYNGRVYWVDSCGNRENVADSGAVHSVYNQVNGRILSDASVKNNVGYCKIEEGKSCGVNSDGSVGCLDMNCDVGESFYMETNFDPEISIFLDTQSVKMEQKLLGETYYQQKGNRRLLYTQHAPDKENTKIRKNGESWCMMWPQPGYNDNAGEANSAPPGSRDYVFRCISGKIEIESCDDYRSETCVERCEVDASGRCIKDTIGAKCEDNTWEGCIGASQSSCNDQNKLCRFVKNECVPLVPPGNVFWSEGVISGNEAKCEKCGGGLQTCDERSCVRLGDCAGIHVAWYDRAWRMALVAGIVVATLATFGIGFTPAVTAGTPVYAAEGGGFVTASGIPVAASAVEAGAVLGVEGAVGLVSTTIPASGFLSTVAAVPGLGHLVTAPYWAGDHIGLTRIFGGVSAAESATSQTNNNAVQNNNIVRPSTDQQRSIVNKIRPYAQDAALIEGVIPEGQDSDDTPYLVESGSSSDTVSEQNYYLLNNCNAYTTELSIFGPNLIGGREIVICNCWNDQTELAPKGCNYIIKQRNLLPG